MTGLAKALASGDWLEITRAVAEHTGLPTGLLALLALFLFALRRASALPRGYA